MIKTMDKTNRELAQKKTKTENTKRTRELDQESHREESHKERGSGSVYFAIVLAVLIPSFVMVIALGLKATGTKTHAQAVADLAALAGAMRSAELAFTTTPDVSSGTGSRACDIAQTIVEANATEDDHTGGIELEECWISGADTYVKVKQTYSLLIPFEVSAKAKAGVVY